MSLEQRLENEKRKIFQGQNLVQDLSLQFFSHAVTLSQSNPTARPAAFSAQPQQ